MIMFKLSKTACTISLFMITLSFAAIARDTIVEFKGACFIPTNNCFQKIYGHAAGIFGPEITVDICNTKTWYAFASVDYLKKSGHSIGLCNQTSIRMVPLAFGLKYFTSLYCTDLYAGLGLQPVHLKTDNCSPFVEQHTSQWCLGGIAKFGTYVNITCDCLLDFFINYSFVKAPCPKICLPSNETLTPRKANISGVIIGIGLAYNFDL